MQLDLNIIAAITALVVGFSAFWSNPKRQINRIFLTLSAHTALWMGSVKVTMDLEDLFLMKVTTAIGAFMLFHLWVVKETLIHSSELIWKKVLRGWRWLLWCSLLAALPFTEWFIPAHSTPENPIFGVGYYGYLAGLIGGYILLFWRTLLQSRKQSGATRMELQLLLLGGCIACGCVMVIMLLRGVWGPFLLARLKPQPLIVLIFYLVTVVAISTRRIFDARQILLVGLQKSVLVAVVAAGAFAAYTVFEWMVSDTLAIFATTAVGLWWAAFVSAQLDKLLQFYPEAKVARQAAFSAAQRENRAENLERAFLSVLKGWGQSEQALILSGRRENLVGQGIAIRADAPAISALRQLQWATPERLARERSTSNRDALLSLMEERKLGVMVIAEGPSLTVVSGVGVGASRRPFTYPQVTQLMELASIMESALERAHFSAKVQHTEQLATVGLLGASLAHEIRNPLVSIKTFVQLLPTHHQDPRFREKFFKLIGDEVGRIDQLTEQLLDLASPRTYEAKQIELHPLLRSSLDLVAAKAAHRNVRFMTEFEATPDAAFTDASAAKQVMLNLCFNAIQAVEMQDDTHERWVKIATRNTPTGIEMAVADSGPGIAPEIRPRLFQPFQTTKSTGFGLGLAICSDILANLNASISVDPPAPGCGATFRVTFPCQPLSS